MKKILVTGSSGYIGSSFVKMFENKHDFTTFSLLQNSIESIEFINTDVIVHCAALVHQKIQHSYEAYEKINIEYPLQLAKKAKDEGVKHFVFISTIAVYGENQEVLDENTPCEPSSFYGKSKLEAEKQLQKLSDESFCVSIVRIPMVYGKGAPGNIATLIKLIQMLPMLPFANIHNKRTFLYIDNLLCFIDLIIKKQQGGVFLLGDEGAISTSTFMKMIIEGVNKRTYLISIPFFQNLVQLLQPSLYNKLYTNLEVNSSHTKKITNFSTPYTTKQAIARMMQGSSR